MLRRNIALFIKRNKKKIILFLQFVGILIAISFLASLIISFITYMNSFSEDTNNEISNIQTQETIIYGDNIEPEIYTSDEDLIKEFINNCNQGKVKEAYSMISDDCKNVYYSSEEEFETLYVNQIFYVGKIGEITSWISANNLNTYKLKLYTDTFDLGYYYKEDYIEDYYTIVNDNNEKKISINKFIKNEDINKKNEGLYLDARVIKKEIYMDYEIYQIEFKNLTEDNIIIDSRENSRTIYLLDTNDVKYSSYAYELFDDDLVLEKNESKVISIKFNKMYNPDVKISSMEFKDIRKENNIMSLSINIQ